MFRNATSTFDRLLEKATSNLLLEPDWPSILAICDSIRGGDTPPKYAVSAIKKRFYHENPHVQLFALQVMESCVKNCGSLVHGEIATKQFMEELRDLVKQTNDENIKKKILEMIQHWGMAFRNSPRYRIATDTLNLMKAEGWEFPPVREAEAMFEADVAPEWAEGEVCHRCRTAFGVINRQHHCRACGQVFCSKCSSRSCVLPKFGIEREVRVCDSCFEQYGPKDSGSGQNSPAKSAHHPRRHQGKTPSESEHLPAEYLSSSLAQQAQTPAARRGGKTEEEIKEEEELQLAIALSQSEAESKENEKKRATNQIIQQSTREPEKIADEKAEEISPELMRYLNRDYWEEREQEKETKTGETSILKKPATSSVATPASTVTDAAMPAQSAAVYPQAGAMAGLPANTSDKELDEFGTTLKTQVEIFVNRMKSNSSRGRSIANDSSVQTLFMNTMAMHSNLLKHIEAQEEKRIHFEGLQDKLTQIKDARAALEALREEERERKRAEAEEAERIRQIQMQEKLEVMRRKKQEYLEYQRQMALQRMQDQERELMMKQEQARQQYSMMQASMPPQQPGMPPQGQPPMYGYQQPQPIMHPGGFPGYPVPGSDPNMGVPGAPQGPNPPTSDPQAPNPAMPNSPYNMQGMVSALPTQGIMSNQPYNPQGAPPPQPQQGQVPPHHPGMPPMGGQLAPQPGQQPYPPQQMQMGGAPPAGDASGMPQPGAPPQSQLISFD